MEEISLKELLLMFWTKKIQIILILVLFVVVGIIYSFLGAKIPVFESTTTLLLATNSREDIMEIGTETLNAKLVPTYSEIVKSDKVLGKAISNLQLDTNIQIIRNGISVTSVEDTEIIKISVRNQDPAVAAKVTNEIAKVFIETIKEFYGLQNVYVVDDAKEANSPIKINHMKKIVIFAFVGVVVAAIYVLADNMLKEQEKIEATKDKPDVINLEIHLND